MTVAVLCPGESVNRVVHDYPVYPYVRTTHVAMLISDMRLVELCWWQLWTFPLIIKTIPSMNIPLVQNSNRYVVS